MTGAFRAHDKGKIDGITSILSIHGLRARGPLYEEFFEAAKQHLNPGAWSPSSCTLESNEEAVKSE